MWIQILSDFISSLFSESVGQNLVSWVDNWALPVWNNYLKKNAQIVQINRYYLSEIKSEIWDQGP